MAQGKSFLDDIFSGDWLSGLGDLLTPLAAGAEAAAGYFQPGAYQNTQEAFNLSQELEREELAQRREIALQELANQMAVAQMQAGAANAATKQRAKQALMEAILKGGALKTDALSQLAQNVQAPLTQRKLI